MRPIALSDAQLGLVLAAAGVVRHAERDDFLKTFANQLPTSTPDDATVRQALAFTLTEGSNNMLTRDVIHRLRIRANEAQAQGQEHLAQDLRLALDALIRLDREQQLTRPTLARPQILA